MPHSNYPFGAQYDPRAPFDAPTVSDECEYEHYDDEHCEGYAEFQCADCEKHCCSVALVNRQIILPAGVLSVKLCGDCAQVYKSSEELQEAA